jgi:phosphate acetyltransferase
VALRRGDSFATLFAQCQSLPPVSCGVIYPCDGPSLQGAQRAVERGLIDPLLIGPEAKIRAVAESEQIDLSSTRIHPTEGARAAAVEAVQMARDGKLQTLMKGSLHTDELLGAVVSSAHGLRTDRRVSHVFVMDVPSYPRMLLITDSAINVAPGLEEKVDIVQNAIDLAHILGIEQPRAAILSAVETVSGKIASTVEAAALCKMADRGQIRGGLLDGPLAFDNAISQRAAEAKNICSAVAGRADLLVVPNLEAGNMLAKQLSFLGGAEAAGIVMGARVPIVLTSRADSLRARLASTAVARLVAGQRDEQPAGGN